MGTSNLLGEGSTHGLTPLLVGVTGHRDLRDEDLPLLEKMVGDVFAELRQAYPHTPLVLLSPLAEGADRLAARVALRAGLTLHAPLPMDRAQYAQDFTSAQSLQEFESLLNRAAHAFVLPPLPPAGGQSPEETRSRLYYAVGEYVARHCQVLLALWDGQPSDKAGGTAQIVAWRLQVLPRFTASHLHAPDPVRSGPVVHIITPRQGQDPPEEALQIRKLFPEGLQQDAVTASVYQQIFSRIDAFNQDVLAHAAVRADFHERHREWLFPEVLASQAPAPLEPTRAAFAAADALAMSNQRRTQRSLMWIFGLAFLAIAAFEITSSIFQDQYLGLLVHPLILIAAFWWNALVRRREYQNKHQDYRALAEGLRVQYFWRLAGLKLPVEEHYLRKQRGELHWIRCSLRIFWSLQGGDIGHVAGPANVAEHQARLAQVLEHWVNDQQRFFQKAGQRELGRHRRLETWAGISLVFALGLAVVLGVALSVNNPIQAFLGPWLDTHPWGSGVIMLLTGLPLVLAALLHSYGETQALGAHARQYRAMLDLFTNAQERLGFLVKARRDHLQETRELLEELGKEALVENGDWVLLHRDRPLEVPHGR